MIGREEDAEELFERLLALRNDLGLLAEEYDPLAGRLVGNFPQAFSHVSLINSAFRLSGTDPLALVDEGERMVADHRHPTWTGSGSSAGSPCDGGPPRHARIRTARSGTSHRRTNRLGRRRRDGGVMKALTVVPLQAGSATLSDMPEPPESDGPVLVETLAVGVCGTDIEIVSGDYGWAPPGEERLVLGHESLGRVLEAPAGSPVAEGDLVVGIVRRPDPVPCPSCSVLEWDFCRNGQYTERGIKELHGYCSERYRITPDFAVKVDPALGLLGVLLEPTSVVAKAWEQVDRVGGRPHWAPKTVLVTGAGPIGLLAALSGSSVASMCT